MVYKGQLPLAIETIRRGLEMDGNYPLGLALLGQALVESGELDEGIAAMRRAAPQLAPGGYWAKGLLGHYLARQGDVGEALQLLDELLALRRTVHVQRVAIAAIYAGLNDDDRALQWLEEAAQLPGELWFWIPIDPLWARMRQKPAFQRILARWRRGSGEVTHRQA